MCLAQRNREALLRIPPLVELADAEPAAQLHLEYRGADATANPYLALGAIVRAGLEGVRAQLPAPPILDRDPAELDAEDAERYRRRARCPRRSRRRCRRSPTTTPSAAG